MDENGEHHLFFTFEQFKDFLNRNRSPEQKIWARNLTTRTRAYPSSDWCAAVTKHDLDRALRRAYRGDYDKRKAVLNRVAKAVQDGIEQAGLCDRPQYLSCDDLRREEDFLRCLVIGVIDKDKQNGFLC